jgi:hypothetical protein
MLLEDFYRDNLNNLEQNAYAETAFFMHKG